MPVGVEAAACLVPVGVDTLTCATDGALRVLLSVSAESEHIAIGEAVCVVAVTSFVLLF